jgi:probable phosphoglycerate mutase
MTQAKIVYLVRHGQSNDNAAPVFQSYDSELSDKGLRQAGQIAQRISHLEFDALISSPQNRAKQTAAMISRTTGKQVEESALFIERFKPTAIDGKSWHDEAANTVWRAWEKSLTTPDMRIEDGENFDDIVARADAALDFLQHHASSTLVVVTHGHFIRTIVARILLGEALTGPTLKRFYELTSLENTALTVINFKDAFEEEYRWRLWTMNDHAHFAE